MGLLTDGQTAVTSEFAWRDERTAHSYDDVAAATNAKARSVSRACLIPRPLYARRDGGELVGGTGETVAGSRADESRCYKRVLRQDASFDYPLTVVDQQGLTDRDRPIGDANFLVSLKPENKLVHRHSSSASWGERSLLLQAASGTARACIRWAR
jgi:hypothetical protein